MTAARIQDNPPTSTSPNVTRVVATDAIYTYYGRGLISLLPFDTATQAARYNDQPTVAQGQTSTAMRTNGSSSVLISVVMPAYQSAGHVEDAIRSVLAQDYPSIELIVVDDSSTDGTREIVKQIADEDYRVSLVEMDSNCGEWEARLAGIRHAKGELIAFIDSDDVYEQGALSVMANALTRNDSDIVICGIQLVDKQCKHLDNKVRFPIEKTFNHDVFWSFCDLQFGTGSVCNKLYRSSLFQETSEIRMHERIVINADYILNVPIFRRARSVTTIPDLLYKYRQHDTNVTLTSTKSARFARMLRAYCVALETYGKSDIYTRHGINHLYSIQLSFDAYRPEHESELEPWATHISDSVQRILLISPLSICRMLHRGAAGTRSQYLLSPPGQGLSSRLIRGLRRFLGHHD